MSIRKERHYSISPGIDSFDIDVAACELLTLFMADKPTQKLLSRHRFDGISWRYDEYKKIRVPKLMIEIAAIYRLTSWRLEGHEREQERKRQVGVLFPEEASDKMEDLNMHEACNKIIHADEIVIEVRKVRKSPRHYFKEDVRLFGSRGKQEWMAGLWIPEFCDAAIQMPMLDLQF
jgi:hypothetical protein